MRYKSKPVEVEAVKHSEISTEETTVVPVWLLKAIRTGVVVVVGGDTYIKTLDGDMKVSDDDWIIQGIEGELYPCKDSIFQAKYEAVEQEQS